MAFIVPPLPAASRPSNTTTTRRPSCLTQSCAQSSTCSLRSDFSYSLRFIGFPPSASRLFAGGDPQRFRQTPCVIECAVGPAEHVETAARRPSRLQELLDMPDRLARRDVTDDIAGK